MKTMLATPEEPRRACPLGLTRAELEERIGPDYMKSFEQFMRGQTIGVCEGREYSHETKGCSPTVCADNPHGLVVYEWDYERFARGLLVVDW